MRLRRSSKRAISSSGARPLSHQSPAAQEVPDFGAAPSRELELAGWLAGQLFGCLDGLDVFFADVATSYRLDDMMSILFPHLCEDVEFLLPSDPDVEMRDDDDNIDFSGVPAAGGSTSGVASASSYAASPSRGNTTAHRPVQENAVAGPSRLG